MAKYKRPYKRQNHNIPDEIDLYKLEADIAELAKNLDEDGRIKEKKLIQMIRSSIRQSWMKAPNKLYFLNSRKTPDYDKESRRLWKYQCDKCENWFKQNEVEVDHIHGEHSFTNIDDVLNYCKSILGVSSEQLQILCKPCHKTKTLAERKGISFEEAEIEQEVIQFGKLKAVRQHSMLKKLIKNIKNSEVSTADKRKSLYRKYLKENN